jgi:type VI secretion system protein ImpA
MSADQTLPSVAELLQPLEGEAPTGRDLRSDITPQSIYFRLRDARSGARAEERAADNDPGAAESGMRQWLTVRELAITALTRETKDVEIAAWLTESLVRTNGLTGLAAGAALLGGLVEKYWTQGLFPPLDDDGLEGRVAPIAGLNGEGGNGTLLQPLRKLILFERNDGSPLSFWQFERSEEVSTLGEAARTNQRITASVPAFAELEGEAQTAGRAQLKTVALEVNQAMAAWHSLEEALERAAGKDAPPTRRVYELLDKLRRTAERFVGSQQAVEAPSPTPGEDEEATAPEVVTSHADGHLNREAMLTEIGRLAALFRVAEPNSPLSYTLEEAVRRARLGLPELLKEMMPDAAPRAALLSSLGIRPTAE